MRLLKHTTCWICIASQIVLLGCQQQQQQQQQQTPQFIPFKETVRTQAIDSLKCQLIAARHLVNAKFSAINSTSDFIGEKINHDRMEIFSESLTGMYDSIVVIYDANWGKEIEKAFNKRFKEHVYDPEYDPKNLQNKIAKHYSDALLTITADTFMLASDSDYSYGGVQSLQEQFDLNGVMIPSHGYEGHNAILAMAILETVDVTLMTVEGGLIIAGLLGAPESAGWALILTLSGLSLLIVHQIAVAVNVADKDTMMTQLQARLTQDLHGLMLETVSSASNPPLVGGASITMPKKDLKNHTKKGKQQSPVVERLHRSAIENVYPKVINAIFGEGQEQ